MIALYRALSLLILLALWTAVSFATGSATVPTPLETAEAAARLMASGEIAVALSQSLAVYFTGYAIAAVFGVSVGAFLGGFPTLGLVTDPYTNALASTPRVAFIPLIIVLLGLGFEAKITVVFLGAVIPIIINTHAGVLNASPELVEMARSTGARRGMIFTHILLPGALPFIVSGLRLGAAVGLINTVVAELYTAVQGLGGLLAIYGNSFRMAEYFVVLLALAAVGIAMTQALRALEWRISRWRHTET